MKKDKLLLEKIKKQINKAKVVSFDIFDTLLVRPYIRPIDLFEHMEKAYERPGFATERRDAERRTRIKHIILEDITFDMIYEEIHNEFKDLKQKELDWEEMVLRANPELKQVYDYALEQGKKIVIASDMYLPTEFLAKVLRKNGFDKWDNLYVSGDLQKSKRLSLFPKVIEDLNILPEKILHIGDNSQSDINSPSLLGFKTQWYRKIVNQYTSSNRRMGQLLKQAQTLGTSILIAFLAQRWQNMRCGITNSQNYWKEFGYQYFGPIAYGYARFIEREAKQEQIDNILFVARDCYTIQRVFNVFNHKIKNHYIYANGSIRRITSCKVSFRVVDSIEYIINFFSKIDENIKEKTKNLQTVQQKKIFITENKQLFKNELFRKWYEKYIRKFISPEDKLFVVDAMARSFSSLALINDFVPNKAKGIYWAYLKENVAQEFNFTTFAHTDFGQESLWEKEKWSRKNIDIFTKDWDFMEFLFCSPEQSIKYIDENAQPVFEKTENPDKLYRAEIYPFLSDGAVEFANEIQEYFKGNDIFLDFSSLVKYINIFLKQPTKTDFIYWSKIIFFFGDDDSGQKLLFPLHRKKYTFIKKIETSKGKKLSILGVDIYSETASKDKIKKKICYGLLKKIKTSTELKIYFLGVCIYKGKLQKRIAKDIVNTISENNLNRLIQTNISTALLHQKTFPQFKCRHKGEDIFILATAPSAVYFDEKEHNICKNAVFIGVNKSILKFDNLNYYFVQDYTSVQDVMDQVNKYSGNNCIKFYGLTQEYLSTQPNRLIPESDAIAADALRYRTDWAPVKGFTPKFTYDIASCPLGCFGSIIFPAMQFALWTMPKRIFLVGADCTNGHFYTGGLRGLFRDVYTKSFLDDHPEIDQSTVELIDEL